MTGRKKSKMEAMKKYRFIGTVRWRWIQEEHIKFQAGQLEIPYLKKEQYIIATFSPNFANQFILLQKMIPDSSMQDAKRKWIELIYTHCTVHIIYLFTFLSIFESYFYYVSRMAYNIGRISRWWICDKFLVHLRSNRISNYVVLVPSSRHDGRYRGATGRRQGDLRGYLQPSGLRRGE